MDWLYGRQPTLSETMRQNRRTIAHAVMNLDREKLSLEEEETKMKRQIQKYAKLGHIQNAQTAAKIVVRVRRYGAKLFEMKMQLESVSMQLLTFGSTVTMTEAMRGAARAMRAMTVQLNIPNLQAIVVEFEKQSDIMGGTQQMVLDSIDGAVSTADEGGEVDFEANKVLEELNIVVVDEMGSRHVPTGPVRLGLHTSSTRPTVATTVNGTADAVARSTFNHQQQPDEQDQQPAASSSAPPPSPLDPDISLDPSELGDDFYKRLNELKRP